MQFLLVLAGIVMLTSAVRNTQGQLITLVKGDFTGKGNFIYWGAAMGILGGLGYVGPLKTPARYMMALVLVVLFLKNGGVFAEFVAAINGEANTSTFGIQTGGTSSTANQSAPPLTDFLQDTPVTSMIGDSSGSSLPNYSDSGAESFGSFQNQDLDTEFI